MNQAFTRLQKYVEDREFVIVPDSREVLDILFPQHLEVFQLESENNTGALLVILPDDMTSLEFNRLLLSVFNTVKVPNGNMDRMAFARKGIKWL